MNLYSNKITITITVKKSTATGPVYGGNFDVIDKEKVCSVTPLKYRGNSLEHKMHEESQNEYSVRMPITNITLPMEDENVIGCKQGSFVEYLGRKFRITKSPEVYTNVIPHIEFVMVEDLHT